MKKYKITLHVTLGSNFQDQFIVKFLKQIMETVKEQIPKYHKDNQVIVHWEAQE